MSRWYCSFLFSFVRRIHYSELNFLFKNVKEAIAKKIHPVGWHKKERNCNVHTEEWNEQEKKKKKKNKNWIVAEHNLKLLAERVIIYECLAVTDCLPLRFFTSFQLTDNPIIITIYRLGQYEYRMPFGHSHTQCFVHNSHKNRLLP